MIKWLFELVYAFKLKKQMQISFWQALRFVRCDHLVQQEIMQILGMSEDHSRKDISDEEE